MKHLMTLVLLCLVCVACHRSGSDTAQDQTRRNTLAAVDDSIRQMSPCALPLIERHLKEATDSLTWYEYWFRRGKYYLYTTHPDSMLPYTAAVIHYAERQTPTPRVNSLLAFAYEAEAAYRQNQRKELERVPYWRDKAYQALLQSDRKDELPNLMANMADCYVLTNELPKAAAAYRRALFLADSLKLPEEESITLYIGLASIYMNLGDYQETLRLYQKSYAYLDRLHPKMQVMLVNNFGNYYYYRRQYDEALKKFLQLKDLVSRTEGDKGFFMYLCKINLSDVYLNLGQLDKAAQCVAEADSFFRAQDIPTGVYYANTIRMGLSVKQGHPEEVPRILAAEHISAPIDHSLERIRNNYLRQYYLATGNARAAYDNMLREGRVEDSLAENRSYMRASEIIQRFTEDTLAMHNRIAMAQKEREKNEVQTTVYVLIAAVLILLLAFAVWWLYNRKKQVVAEMNLLKQRMENARNRMSPHFVFNILNNRMVSTNQQERDELMTLAKLIRRSLDLSHAASTPLGEELRFVSDYVELQRYVLRPDFDFRIDAPDDPQLMTDVQVPSMFVQILVENAIKHGLKGLDRPQAIHITIADDGLLTTITVQDNGRGFGTGGAGHKGTGLSTMFQTIDTLNTHNKRRPMDIDIHNSHDAQGAVTGCVATLTIPHGYQYS